MSETSRSDATMPDGGTQDAGNPDVTGFQPDPQNPGADPEHRADEEMGAAEASTEGEADDEGEHRRGERYSSSGSIAGDDPADRSAEGGRTGHRDGDRTQHEGTGDDGHVMDRPEVTDLNDREDRETWDDVKADYQVAPEDAPEDPMG